MPYDLFISYSRRDNTQGCVTQLVEHIGRDFEQFAGRPLRPFFDVTEIKGMDDWRHRILQGLRESRLLFACISPSYLASEYCEWEFNEYLKHEAAHASLGEGVAPIYLIEVPGWQDKDFERRSAEWVAELRRRQYFDLRSWFREGREALRNADVQARMEKLKAQINERIRRGERSEQSLGNVYAPNAHFVGRITELRRLHETVARGKVGVLIAVHGLGGMGKTALAIEYAHANAHEYGGGRWQVRCEGRDNLAAATATLATALHFEFTDDEKLDSERQLQRVLVELHSLAKNHEPNRCLLLLDNVDQPKLLEPAQLQRLPATDWLHVIATTRLGETDLFGRHQDRAFLPVDELPEADALDLIESFQPGGKFPSEAERNDALAIVRLLGRFTLAVEAAAVYLGQFAGDVTCSSFLARLKKEGLEGLEGAAGQTTEGLLHDEKSLTATLRPTLDRLDEPEKLALTYGALLPADHIALPWIRALVAMKFSEFGQDSEPGYPDPWKSLLRRLFGLRLWQPTNLTDADGQPLVARMHRLLQELMKNDTSEITETEQALMAHIKAQANFLRDGWVQHEHRWELGPLAGCAWQWLEQEGDVGPWLASQVGLLLRKLGNFTESERLHRRSIERTHADHPNYAGYLHNLTQVLTATNRLTEAEPLIRRALAIDEKRYGPDHPEVALDLNSLALLLKDTNRLAEAEPLLRRALTIDEKRHGPDHPHVAIDLNNLAQLLHDKSQLTEAEPLMRRALAIDEKRYGPDHPNVARNLSNLALLLQAMNRMVEAEPLLRRALAIDEHIYGPVHPTVGKDLNNLARFLHETNRPEEAEPLLRRALLITEHSYGPDHPKVVTRLTNLARLLHKTNRSEEAEPLIRRALVIAEHSYGPNHPSVSLALAHLARLLHDTNRLAEAEPLRHRALAIDEHIHGPDHPSVAASLYQLARLLHDTNRRTEAEPLMRRALSILEHRLGPDHPHTIEVLDKLKALVGNF
jgi:tetratricopeptide (TPR) repeat protein